MLFTLNIGYYQPFSAYLAIQINLNTIIMFACLKPLEIISLSPDTLIKGFLWNLSVTQIEHSHLLQSSMYHYIEKYLSTISGTILKLSLMLWQIAIFFSLILQLPISWYKHRIIETLDLGSQTVSVLEYTYSPDSPHYGFIAREQPNYRELR